MERQELKALTGLRFFAAAAIVALHYGGMYGFPRLTDYLHNTWSLSHPVSVFFVLSGFVLTYKYAGMNRGVLDFYGARVARIWPMHLFALAAVIALGVSGTWKQFVANVFLVQGWVPIGSYFFSFNAPSWSVSTEVGFYLLFPLLVHNIERTWHWKLALSIAASLILPVWASAINAPDYGAQSGAVVQGFVMTNPLSRLFQFVAGMSTAAIYLRYRPRLPAWGWTLASAAAGVVFWFNFPWINQPVYDLLRPPGALAYWLADAVSPTVPAALFIFTIASGKGVFAGFLAWQPIWFLGASSYSLYLLHFPSRMLFDRMAPALVSLPEPVVYSLLFGMALGSAILAYLLVEEPARRWLRARLAQLVESYQQHAAIR